ncbi:copper transporter [Flagelloscypha sp. PMI_526]|nr:copper transporter [Flagelloscypha sp. PMI_526]
MDHSAHSGHDMPTPSGPRCSMNMLWYVLFFTGIVFRQWHIGSSTAFASLGILYEYLKACQKAFDRRVAISLAGKDKGKARRRPTGSEDDEPETAGLLTGKKLFRSPTGVAVPLVTRILRACLYASTVFLSFFLMLVFMTYNAYLILATVIGAGLGHYIFNSTLDPTAVLGLDDKGMACH